jgi:hypothetical protein
MAQHDFNIANQSFPSFRTDLNNALSAINTSQSGTSRPSGAVAGTIWLDTTSPTTPTLKYYDGADDISLATIDHSANTVNWLDSTVSITGLSTTATGTVLTLTDSASTSTVNLIIDNQKEIRFRETTANGTNYVALKAPASVSADLTFTLPATDGTAGQVLQTNGSGVLSFATVGGLAWQSIVTASTLTAVAGRGYWINTTSNACTVTLPASATNGDTIILADYARTWGTNAVTINTNSLNFQGATTPNPIYNTNRQSVTLVYSGATQGWIPTVDDDVSYETPPPYSLDFLVIAGGGAGGFGFANEYGGGGGGAGGYRNSFSTETSGGGGSSESTITFVSGVTYTITVGAGGTAGTNGTNATSGNNSSITGSGFSTITSTGGGRGESVAPAPANASATGGSGGGGGTNAISKIGSAGTANQGYAGGDGSPDQPNDTGGGGGGAGAVGANGTSGGGGGNGVASSITGSSITRAGGGGGGLFSGTSSGGTGGGGAGNSGAGTSGTANTGGGGGASSYGATSGAGGSGVVILRMLTTNYSGITTGSPTVTTNGSDTILVYNASGSYTG